MRFERSHIRRCLAESGVGGRRSDLRVWRVCMQTDCNVEPQFTWPDLTMLHFSGHDRLAPACAAGMCCHKKPLLLHTGTATHPALGVGSDHWLESGTGSHDTSRISCHVLACSALLRCQTNGLSPPMHMHNMQQQSRYGTKDTNFQSMANICNMHVTEPGRPCGHVQHPMLIWTTPCYTHTSGCPL
jgi:hypothetical protein